MPKTIIISLDAVGDEEFDTLLQYPNFQKLYRASAVFRGATSVFPTITYPIHASVATGLPVGEHGVLNNYDSRPVKDPVWNFMDSANTKPTLWGAAKSAGLTTAALSWPVAGGARDIRYNIAEIMARPGKSQAVTSLRASSPLLLLREYLLYGKLLNGIAQPERDRFFGAAAVDIIRRHHPDLTLLHLTGYDALCHHFGRGSAELRAAYETMDDVVGALMAVLPDDTTWITFSDHSQLNVDTFERPNDLLVAEGWMTSTDDGLVIGGSGCFFEVCGGSAFFHPGTLSAAQIAETQAAVESMPGFRRLLSEAEMKESGRGALPFGMCAKPGFCYTNYENPERADHGYPVDYEQYRVFYTVRGAGYTPGTAAAGGSVLAVSEIAARALGIAFPFVKK